MLNNDNAKSYYNEAHDIIVKFTGEEFVIIGDEKKVSNKTLLALHQDNAPKVWQKVVR